MPFEIPEFPLLSILESVRDRLKDGTFWKGDKPVFGTTVPRQELEDFKRKLRDRPLKVGQILPTDTNDLPCVTVIPEEWSTAEAVLGEVPWEHGEAQTSVSGGEIVITSASAGQVTALLQHPDVVDRSLVLLKDGTEITEGTDFTIDLATGRITFTPALSGGEAVTASEYSYYSEGAERAYGEISNMTTRFFVEAEHPRELLMIVAIVRRELFLQKHTLEQAGLQNLQVTVVPLSPWAELLPAAIATRREMVVSYVIEQTAEVALTVPRAVRVSFVDQTGEELVDYEGTLGYEDKP